MTGGVAAHEVSSSSHTHPPSTYAGVRCGNTTRSPFMHLTSLHSTNMQWDQTCPPCTRQQAHGSHTNPVPQNPDRQSADSFIASHRLQQCCIQTLNLNAALCAGHAASNPTTALDPQLSNTSAKGLTNSRVVAAASAHKRRGCLLQHHVDEPAFHQ
jgi:hypothetical protein